ncbi:glycine cleavage system protein R [Photobacterium kagoshimensis]|uniref:glycine cleavage system protein R n=1 Tax=Photobacterium kagoshimensis TaxID=2910242 RepID=UPI003D1052F4
MKHLVITVIGKDRPGLVEQLSDVVYSNHGNWLSSSLSKLAGQFAGILHIEVASQHLGVLRAALSQIDALQIQIVEEQNETQAAAQLHHCCVTANDRPGIVNDVTTLLSQLGVNIDKLETNTQSAPNWGYPIFTAHFDLELPPALGLDTVQQELENLADDLTVDFDESLVVS